MKYKKNFYEAKERMDTFWKREAKDEIRVQFTVKNRPLENLLKSKKNEISHILNEPPQIDVIFKIWETRLKIRTELLDDSVPVAQMSHFDEGIYGAIVGGPITYLYDAESGVISSMLRHHGLNLSEPMIFGISNALNFAYIPFVKLGGMPLVAYRSIPKSIVKNIKKNLGVDIKLETFSSKKKGEDRLDELLDEGKIVGAQSSMYWLSYIPNDMRFHFNAHNLLIYGKEDNEYLISDPVFQMSVRCDKESLSKARFTKGVMAPKGLLYYPISVPTEIDLKPIIAKNIKKLSKTMLRKFVPIAGIVGIKSLAKAILKLKSKEKKYAKLFLGNIIRMQEEIGTGGAGFRFMYASFLQESSELFENDAVLAEASKMMLQVGDEYREFALMIAKSIKSKKDIDFEAISKNFQKICLENMSQLLDFKV